MQEIMEIAGVDLVAGGFRIRGTSAKRRSGRTDQAIWLQTAKGAHADFGRFFVDVGVHFDEVTNPGGVTEWHGKMHWETRLERICPALPASHALVPSTDRAALAARLREGFAVVLQLLDRIDSPASALVAFQEAPAGANLDAGGGLAFHARLRYAAQDYDGALAELIELKRAQPQTDVVGIAASYQMDKLGMSRV